MHADKELPAPQTIQRLEKQVNRNSLRELVRGIVPPPENEIKARLDLNPEKR